VSLQAFAPSISDETAYVINRMLHKEPDKRYGTHEELLTHLHYARQRLQQRTSALKGASGSKPRHAERGGNRLAVAAIWTTAAILCLGSAGAFFAIGKSVAKSAPAAVATPRPGEALAVQGREALDARQFDKAAEHFAAAVAASENRQPAQNWALAQLGLSFVLLGDEAKAKETFARLDKDAIFDASLGGQSFGRFFLELARRMEDGEVIPWQTGAGFDPAGAGAFAWLAFGLRDWTAGDVATGGALLDQFDRSDPLPPNRWIGSLKPLAAPYLVEYRRFVALQEKVKRAKPTEAADLLVQIEQAKNQVKTGPEMAARLDDLARDLHLD